MLFTPVDNYPNCRVPTLVSNSVENMGELKSIFEEIDGNKSQIAENRGTKARRGISTDGVLSAVNLPKVTSRNKSER